MTINKANSISSSPSIKVYQREEQQAKTQAPREQLREARTPTQQEFVHITENGRQLHQQDQDINQQNVDRIKQAISDGTFKIQVDKIADKLIQETVSSFAKK
nr:flagellar biosynthesis anti-sigma factor FlgM [uncultured Moellerella sp.]